MIYVHSRLFYLQCCHWFPAERNEMCRGICSRWERTVRRTRRPSHSEVRSFLNHTWIRSKPKKERMKIGLAYYQLSKQEGFFHVSYDISGTLVVLRWNLNSRCKTILYDIVKKSRYLLTHPNHKTIITFKFRLQSIIQ